MEMDVKYSDDGLVPVISQDAETREVLTLAYMNAEALAATLATGKAHYYSRSRGRLWMKGEESGNIQEIVEIKLDCDGDALLLLVKPAGPACHTGHKSCFYRDAEGAETCESVTDEERMYSHRILRELHDTVRDRKAHPVEGSYTNYLFNKGLDKILKKIGEEAAEIIIASKNPDNRELIYETADFMYHLCVLLVNNGLTWDDIFLELRSRAK
ncbi:MAG: bifunctional phosphoribosyl-AMP cyclohydrolase/phosphoribosyl-ATP diphosphatase HisIE [Clostridiales bacterium]|jgi:phosphoribosyl-ATP pyrophosphohydrolase/phosphoribosyl-AMP cyclohydrolase|nr:bifunctional phosphoribosyl-AMP cyclohydrolase/phosphoribosyl-ATP diphosphatase HisIE [Clostridiales bacterium]